MPSEVEVKKSVCLWCKGECGVLVHVKDGRLLKIEQDPNYPRRALPGPEACVRALAAKEFVYHPDRLKYPLKRAGERGEGKWERIGWGRALDEIAEKLKEIREKYGPEAYAQASGTYRTHAEYARRFRNIFGSPNEVSTGTICSSPRTVAGYVTCGFFPYMSVGSKTRCVVLLGVQVATMRPATFKKIRDAMANGAKLIVIDPRRTHSASMATLWLPLRHGTDVALLMGMANVMIEEKLYDKDFVEKWCYGFDELAERAADYPLERAAEITRLPAEKVREAARIYATNKPGCFVEGMGVEHLRDAFQALHARWILAALAGNIDVEGGEEVIGAYKFTIDKEVSLGRALTPEQKAKMLGGDRFRLFSWQGHDLVTEAMKKAVGYKRGSPVIAHAPTMYRAILTGKPYPIKALITYAHNPMVIMPNTKLIYKALKSSNLELHVVLDLWLTPTAELADYVFPMACWLERPVVITPHSDQRFMTSGVAALPLEHERMTEFDFYRNLAVRLGQVEFWPWKTLEESYDARLKHFGMTHREFVEKIRFIVPPRGQARKEGGCFGTPTGKVELYSTILEKLGYDPLPNYREPPESPLSTSELTREYPLMLITGGRPREYYHSEWRQIESVRQLRPFPILQVHPDTARPLGISEGDWVWVETCRGRAMLKAQLFDGISQDTVNAENGWWYPELPGEEPWLHGVWISNINVVTLDEPDQCGEILGSFPLKTNLCKIYKAELPF